MDLVNLLSKLQAISEEKKKPDADKDGVPDWADKNHGEDDTEKKSKANEDIEAVLRGLKAIQEGSLEEDEVEEGNEFAQKVQQLKSQGAKPGTKFKTSDGKEHVLEAEETCDDCGKTPCECDGHDHVDEGIMDKAKEFAKKAGQKALDTLGHGSDEEVLKDLQKKMGVPPEHRHGKPSMAQQNEELSALRALAGIQECGMEMSPMTAVGGEPQMGINPAMPAEVPTIGAQPEPEQMPQAAQPEEPKARYTLTVQNGDSSLSMSTDVPDEIIHVMKLAGVKGQAKVTQGQDGQLGAEQKTEESFGNTPAQTNEPNPRLHGDITDWSQKGTGRAQDGSAANKPAGQGDNPMRESLAMLEEYRKFLSK